MAWEVTNASGLGNNYKEIVTDMANKHGYGSIYYAKRMSDDGGNHRFLVRTKKWFGLSKYEFVVYTRYSDTHKEEVASGYGPDVTVL